MIRSMTAFARVTVPAEGATLIWELKSVNHRYLEVSPRLPEAFRDLEGPVREMARKRLGRGKVEISFRYQLAQDSGAPVSYTHLTLPTTTLCRSRWSPYH